MRHLRLFESFRDKFTKEILQKALELAETVMIFYHDGRQGDWYTLDPETMDLGDDTFFGTTDEGDVRELKYDNIDFVELEGNRMSANDFHQVIQNNVNTNK